MSAATYTITQSDSGKWLLRFEPDGQARSRGVKARSIASFLTREAAEARRDGILGRRATVAPERNYGDEYARASAGRNVR